MNRKYRRFCFLHRTATAYPWGELQELLFVDGTSDMPERIPVYSDPYPSDHGDPEYEFPEEVKGIRSLTEFPDILYGKHGKREYETVL